MDTSKYIKMLESDNNASATSNLNLNSKVLVVDALNHFIRNWSVNPVMNDVGLHIGGISGFLTSLGFIVKTFKPTRVILVFDGKGGSQRRRSIYSEYKNNRAGMPTRNRIENPGEDFQESMTRQFQVLSMILDTLPVTVMVIDQIEADDAIGYICSQIIKNKDTQECIIVSSDRDYLQLVDEKTFVWSPVKKKLYNKESVLEEYKVSAKNFLLFRCIVGDKSDNIPKIKGVSEDFCTRAFPELAVDGKINIDKFITYAESKMITESKAKMDMKIANAYRQVVEQKDKLLLNYRLMQLYDVDISGNNKMKIQDMFDNQLPNLNKTEFVKILSEHKMLNAIRNMSIWVNEVFNSLDLFIRKEKSKV